MTEAMQMLRGMLDAKGGTGIGFDTGLTTEACYALAAMLIEALPDIRTNGDMRVMAEDAGKRILAYVRTFRNVYEERGVHAIEALGVGTTPPPATKQ